MLFFKIYIHEKTRRDSSDTFLSRCWFSEHRGQAQPANRVFLAKSAEIQQGFVKINDREGKRLTSGLLRQHIKPLHSCWDFMWRLSGRMFLCATAIFSVYVMWDGANRLEKKAFDRIFVLLKSLTVTCFLPGTLTPHSNILWYGRILFKYTETTAKNLSVYVMTDYTAGKQLLPSQPFLVLCSSALQIITLVEE